MGTPDPVEGAKRAAMLEAAWLAGAGRFGARLAEAVWRDWDRFVMEAEALTDAPALAGAPQAWRQTLAIAMTALVAALELADCALEEHNIALLLAQWGALLTAGYQESDPAADAWEALVLMIVGAHTESFEPAGTGWIVRSVNRDMVAYQRLGEDVWRVPTRSATIQERIGPSAVQLYGQAWAARGWIEVDSEGRSTHVNKIGSEGSARVLRIPSAQLRSWRTPSDSSSAD
jgi:hypothetical protein